AGSVGAGVANRRKAREARVLAGDQGELRIRGEAHALAARAAVACGGGFAVVARQRVAEVHAADRGRRAEVGRADVGVVAVRRGAEACAEGARVADRAEVAVVAGNRVEAQEPTRPGAVAGVVGADARGGAGRAERLELARRRAAVTGQGVAIVALLAHVEDPVGADVDRLARDGEQIRLHAADGETRPGHLDEVGAAGAPGD